MTDKVIKTLQELVALDYDAIEAYDAAIARLENPRLSAKLVEFRQDHHRHTENLGEILRQRSEDVPNGPDMKRFLTKGKVVIADMGDDETILKAMNANEKVTNETYEKALKLDDLNGSARTTVAGNLSDEQRHKAWIESQIERR